MTYAQYNLIEASDFNNLIGNNPGNTANALNTTWAVGYGNAGYGQQQVANVAIGYTVANIDWATLINNTANSAVHQGSPITNVTPPSGGNTIAYIAAVTNNLTTIYNNRLNAAAQNPVPVSNTVTSVNTWTSNLVFTQIASFANADAARYFFNAGGQLAITCDHPTGNSINNIFHGLAANIGSVTLSSPTSGVISVAGNSFSGISKLGGAGQTPSIVPNNGYYALTTSNANVFTQTDGVDSTYSSSYINIRVKSNGTQGSYGDAGNVITFYTTWQELPTGTTVTAGTTTTLTAIYPSTSKLANTWGTVTLQGSLPPIGTTTTTTSSGTTTTTTTTAGPPPPVLGQAIFGFGLDGTSTVTAITNLVNNLGVVSNDVTGVGTARYSLAAAGYGGDKAIFGFGDTGPNYTAVTNLVNNLGVVAADQVALAGTPRAGLAAATYGGDKAIFGFGDDAASGFLSMTNLVSSAGVVATDTTGVGTARSDLAAATYGGDKAIFGFGRISASVYSSTTNLVNNLGVIVSETAGVGTARSGLAAAGYGYDQAIFGFGRTASIVSITNLVSNLGIVQANVTNLSYTGRRDLAAARYGSGNAIFGFGRISSASRIINLVSNLGIIVSESAGVGTPRYGLAASGYGGISPSPSTTTTTSGPTTTTTSGPGTTTTTTTAGPVPARDGKAIFGFGWTGSFGVRFSITNKVSNIGIVATDTAGVGTARSYLAAASYGYDKAIFGFGAINSGYTNITNLVNNLGVVANDQAAATGTPRAFLAAAGYGGDKAIFGFGYNLSQTFSITNLVSNTGVVGNDVTGVGTARYVLAAAGYGGDKAIFGFGRTASGTQVSITNKVSNLGVVATDTAGVGTARQGLAATGYGTDKAIFGFGFTGIAVRETNLVSNLGVVAADQTALTSTARYELAAAGYGGDRAIFGFGTFGSGFTSITNKVSSTGVVATDTAGVGTARNALAAAGYDNVPPLVYEFPIPGSYSIAPIPGYPYLIADLVGGGGAGGGNDGFSVSYAGGGGGSGGYSFNILDTTGIIGNFFITVGAGGTAASASIDGTIYPGVPSIPRTGTKNGGSGGDSSLLYSLTNFYSASGGGGGIGNTGANDDGVGGAGGAGVTISGNPGVTPLTLPDSYPAAAGGASVYGGYGAGGVSQNSNFINNLAADLPKPGGNGYARLQFSSTQPTTSTSTTTTTAAPIGTINTSLFTYLTNKTFYGAAYGGTDASTYISFSGNGQFRILDQAGTDLTNGAPTNQYWVSGVVNPGLYYWIRFTQTAVNGYTSSPTTGWTQPGLFGISIAYVANNYYGTTDATYTIQVATDALGTNIVATSTGVFIAATQYAPSII
jgi:hypothetical protein